MMRESFRIYAWMWRETRRRYAWPALVCAAPFGLSVVVDLGRAGLLSTERGIDRLRRARGSLGRLAARCVGAAAFCLLLFGPVLVAFGTATRSPGVVPGNLQVLRSGLVNLDGEQLTVSELAEAVTSLGVASLRITIEGGTSAGTLGRVRGAIVGTTVRTLHLAGAPRQLEQSP